MPDVTHFTDPACPFAFSAEPIRQRLRWRYGEGLRWRTVLIVLTREPGEAELLAGSTSGLQRKYGMPIDPRPRSRPASSEPACRAIVAARLHAPEVEEPLLRRLRVRTMAGGLLDDPALIEAAATEVGLDPAELMRWSAGEDVAAALEADAAAARDPSPAARRLEAKLGGPDEARRYTAPTYVIDDFVVPGFNPVEAYETAIANLAPELERRPSPASVTEVLEWADEPLATAEIAMVMDGHPAEVRSELSAVARFTPAGADGYWDL